MKHILESLNKSEINIDNTQNINLTTLEKNFTQENNTTVKQYTTTKKKTTSSSSKSSKNTQKSRSDDTWGDYEDDTYVYEHGAGSSDDPNIVWKYNKKTGYGEYYNKKNR